MPLDHFVPQVHLSNFYSAKLGGKKMYAFNKQKRDFFICGSEDVCRIMDGSTSNYLAEPRVIEDALKIFEPRYNSIIEHLRAKTASVDDLYCIGLFVATVQTCAPTALRLNSSRLSRLVESEVSILEERGLLPPPPEVLKAKSLSELIQNGSVNIDIDEKFPQAISTMNIRDIANSLTNSKWEIIQNKVPNSPFLTSDYPFGLEASDDPRIFNKLIPIAPDIAVRISPYLESKLKGDVSEFPLHKKSYFEASKSQVVSINTSVSRCAEKLVFYNEANGWIRNFLVKNSGYWVEPVNNVYDNPEGRLLFSSQKIAKRSS